MRWVKKNNVFGYFGTITDNLYHKNQYHLEKFNQIIEKIKEDTGKNIIQLFFPKQIHTADIVILNNTAHLKKPIHLFHENADAVITTEKNVAIGVVTADCLPLFLYDPDNQAIGVIHAGWRGLAAKIITNTILKMQNHFGTNPKNLLAYLGPSADVCCYEVQPDFLSHFPKSIVEKDIIDKRNGKLFFNPKNSAIIELAENNLQASNIDISNHVCTICNKNYCSVRRQKEKAGRQPSFIFLT